MENKNLFCLCWCCRRFHFVCLHLCLYPSACTGLCVHISCWWIPADERPQSCSATPLQLQARGALHFKLLGPRVPCLAQLHRKAPGCSQTCRPSCSEPFIWHLMQKMCPEQFQPCSIKLHYNYTAQSRRLKKTAPPQCNTLISDQR